MKSTSVPSISSRLSAATMTLTPPCVEHDVVGRHAVGVVDRVRPAVAATTAHTEPEGPRRGRAARGSCGHGSPHFLSTRSTFVSASHLPYCAVRQQAATASSIRSNLPSFSTGTSRSRAHRAHIELARRRRPDAPRTRRPPRSRPQPYAGNRKPRMPRPDDTLADAAGNEPIRAACDPRLRPTRDPAYRTAVPAPFGRIEMPHRRPGCIP